MDITPDKLKLLLRSVVEARHEEMCCDEWLDHIGGYVEALRANRPLVGKLQDVRHHMNMCPECAEELRTILDSQDAPPHQPRTGPGWDISSPNRPSDPRA
ncbi:MAG: hypothetical protein C0475_00845 [Planctomyces sp.]|nr:hypothetical protein [Planctomyces sp.]MBA4039937.1 hypothetical protein [Planctomyces sp.]MBA4119444.1 hypothetical protein [Isosphaera sp.]